MVRIRTALNILACCIALLGVAPVSAYIGMLPKIAFLLALVATIVMERRGIRAFQGIVPTMVTTIVFLFYLVQFSRENLVEPATNILVMLLAVRLLSDRIPRNYLQVYALSLFSLAASSLFSLSAMFLVYLFMLIVLIAVSLVLLTFFSDDNRLCLSRRGIKLVMSAASAMPVFSLPLIVIFFIVMPRPQFPLWDFLASTADATTGLSERVEPGSSQQVREVKAAVMRVQSEPLDRRYLYWRGIVLNTPQENAWIRTRVSEQDFVRPEKGRVVQQTIFPEPNTGLYLPVLDAPSRVSGMRSGDAFDLVYRRRPSSGRVKFESTSVLADNIEVSGPIDRELYLRLPTRVSPRVAALARTFAKRGNHDSELLTQVENYFRSARYRYTTRDLPMTGDPIDTFLFESKAGHCEFFATSFMILLRAAGVPSRLVGGYYGGDYNDLGGYYLVTEDMAHVWVEVYVEGVGWVRRDPTTFADNYIVGQEGKKDSFVGRIRMLSDSLSYYWNLTVISYDLDKQMRVFQSANSAVRNISLPFGRNRFLAGFLGLGLAWAGWLFLGKRRLGSREERLVKRFLSKVGRRYPGVPCTTSTGLMELAERTGDPHVQEFARIYCFALYHDRSPSVLEFARLRELLKIV